MRRNLCGVLVVCCVCMTGDASAQSPPNPNYVRQQLYPSYQDFKSNLLATVGIADPTQRTTALNNLWSTLQSAGQVPYAQDNQVAFLYRGSGSSVVWPGDFNGWNSAASSWQGTQFPGTNLWIVEKTLPTDARLDYKVVVNGNWILDPANSLQMWGGFGPNSELRMPDYVFPQETVRQAGIPQGTLTGNITTASTHLGYSVNHRVYTPAGYDAENLSDLPVVYVTDGHEYAADYLGSMVVVLDNLIAAGELQPTMAVFIDPRDPNNAGNNRRASEYTGNANFANFVSDELVPLVDTNFRTQAIADARVILGTSYGGINSAYFGAMRSDVFGKIAVQSPASSSIFNQYGSLPLQDDLELFVTAGTINDGGTGVSFTNLLNSQGYDYSFVQTNESHSWGQWRGLLDDILMGLIGPATSPGDFDNDGDGDGRDFLVWQRGGSPSPLSGIDLADWQANYGVGSLTAANVAVPEPGSLTLLIGLVLLRLPVRRLAITALQICCESRFAGGQIHPGRDLL